MPKLVDLYKVRLGSNVYIPHMKQAFKVTKKEGSSMLCTTVDKTTVRLPGSLQVEIVDGDVKTKNTYG